MNQSQQDNGKATTAHQQQLHPWCLIQQLPRMQNREVARFRRRNDADAHQRVLRQLMPLAHYTIVFDSSSTQNDQEICAQDDKAIALSPNTPG